MTTLTLLLFSPIVFYPKLSAADDTFVHTKDQFSINPVSWNSPLSDRSHDEGAKARPTDGDSGGKSAFLLKVH